MGAGHTPRARLGPVSQFAVRTSMRAGEWRVECKTAKPTTPRISAATKDVARIPCVLLLTSGRPSARGSCLPEDTSRRGKSARLQMRKTERARGLSERPHVRPALVRASPSIDTTAAGPRIRANDYSADVSRRPSRSSCRVAGAPWLWSWVASTQEGRIR